MFKLFLDQSLCVKIMGRLVVMAAITFAVGWIGVRKVQTESSGIERLYQRHVQGSSDLKEAQVELLRALSGQKNALVSYTPEQRESNLRRMEQSERAFTSLVEKIGGDLADSREKSLFDAIGGPWSAFPNANSQIAYKLQSPHAPPPFQPPLRPPLASFSL